MPGDTNGNGNGDLAYWMGKVDTQLVTMNQTLVTLMSNDKSNWRDFNSWRDGVDRRLQDGTANFDRINERLAVKDRELAEIRASYADIMESLGNCQALRAASIQAREAREQALKEKENSSRLDKPVTGSDGITYRWLLERVALPVAIAFLLWLLMTILPDLIRHISVP